MGKIIKPAALTPGTDKWLKEAIRYANNTASYTKADCIPFSNVCLELIENKAWEQYFKDEPKTWERLCKEAIHGTDPIFIQKIIEGVQILEGKGHKGKIPQALAEKVAETEKLNDTPGNPSGNNQHNRNVDNINIPKRSTGTSQTYLIARLKRDNPEIANDLANGKYSSVRKAAIAAGIVKISTPFEQIIKLWKKLSESDKKKFKSFIFT